MTNEEAIEVIKHGCIYRDRRGGDALRVSISALEKQIPKKVITANIDGNIELRYCPYCRIRFIKAGMKYCGECGQALDWDDYK